MLTRLLVVGILCLAPFASAADVLLEHYDVFVAGEVIEGQSYHTYRIPNIARANDGTLIAVAEARLENSADPGSTHIDLVYKRSLDGGKTWTDGTILDRHPDTEVDENGRPTNRTSAANSVTFVDRTTGRVWNMNMRLPHATPSASTQPGVDDMQAWLRYSDDSGASWSEPTRIPGNTADIPYEDFYPNLGSATQLSSGRLVVPATEDNATVASHSFSLYSDDGGATWKAGEQIDAATNEAQIVELADGRLLMSARQNGGGSRYFATSNDAGETWNSAYPAFSTTPVMEGIERYTQAGTDGETVNRLLHTLPVGGPVTARTNLEVRTATDELEPGGPTFDSGRRVAHAFAAYSDLVNIDGDEVGLFWERGDTAGVQRITYTRLNRTFLEPHDADLGLVAHETFDYPAGMSLDAVGGDLAGDDYAEGYAPVNFSGRRDLDLIFSIDMQATGGTVATLDPGLTANDQANGVLGQLFTTDAEAGAVSAISVQRAPNGTAGPPVYVHLYTDVDVSDGIDAATFLGASQAAEDLSPTDSGQTTWTFDPGAIELDPETKYLLAFANSADAGDTTTARAALHRGRAAAGFAMGGSGFNSAWRSTLANLTSGAGASGATVQEGSLVFDGLPLPAGGNHVQLAAGSTLARGLGVPFGEETSGTFYASVLISRTVTSGEGDTGLHLALAGADGEPVASAGVAEDDQFILESSAGTVAAGTFDAEQTYLLVLKVKNQGQPGNGSGQMLLHAFASGDEIPEFDDQLEWTVVGTPDENMATPLDRLAITAGDGATWAIDEVRVGGHFGAVASGAALVVAGDLNRDGQINLADWLAFKLNFGRSTVELGNSGRLAAGDFDQNGTVNQADFVAFRELFNEQHGPGAFSAAVHRVPEPRTFSILALGAVAARKLGLTLGCTGKCDITPCRHDSLPSANDGHLR